MEREMTTTIDGVFKIHGIPVYLDSLVLTWNETDDVHVLGARKKTRRRGEVNLEEISFMKPYRVTLLDMLNDFNDFSEYAIEYEKERYEHEKELRWMARDYYNNLLSR
jgi:hypothetical protein